MAKLTRRIVASQLFRLSCSRDISPSLHRQRSGHDRGHVVRRPARAVAPIVQSGTGSSSAAISPATTRMRMIQAIFWNSIKGACDKEGWLKDLGTVEERCDFPIWVDVPIPVDWAAKARLLEFDPRKAGSADDIGQARYARLILPMV